MPCTPNVKVKDCNLRDKVLLFMTLPVPNKDDPEHYLSPAVARAHIESTNMTADDLRVLIPSTKKEERRKKSKGKNGKDMAELRKLDKGLDFNATKVRATVKCHCGATRVIYSNHAVGQTGKPAPTHADMENLQRSLENNVYTCGDEIKGGGKYFYVRRALQCGSPIEASYYTPSTGTKGNQIVTADICAVCYVDADLVSPNDIRKERTDLGGRTHLTVCRECLESPHVELAFSGKRVNIVQAKRQKQVKRKRQENAAVKRGRKKCRSTK